MYLSRFQVETSKISSSVLKYICGRANGWDAATNTMKLPTLLKREALAVWLDLMEEMQRDYAEAKRAIEKALMSMNFVSLEDFHRQKLCPGEAISPYIHDLKKLLTHAIPDME